MFVTTQVVRIRFNGIVCECLSSYVMRLKPTPLQRKLKRLDRQLSELKKSEARLSGPSPDPPAQSGSRMESPARNSELNDEAWSCFPRRRGLRRARRNQRVKALLMLVVVVLMSVWVTYRLARL